MNFFHSAWYKKIFFFALFITIFSSCNNTASTNDISVIEGKPAIIIFAQTSCAHCQTFIKELEERVWTPYKDKLFLWINVIDKKTFPTKIPQGWNNAFDFTKLSLGQSCMFVPAFIVLDQNTQPKLVSCGGEKSIEDIQNIIPHLLLLQ